MCRSFFVSAWSSCLEAEPCPVSELPLRECGGSSFRSSVAWELNGRPSWELEARLCLGLQDWAGGLRGHRTGCPPRAAASAAARSRQPHSSSVHSWRAVSAN